MGGGWWWLKLVAGCERCWLKVIVVSNKRWWPIAEGGCRRRSLVMVAGGCDEHWVGSEEVRERGRNEIFFFF
ncbi:hypothetical protein CsSME_00002527 [Camellia sinensis var. sinensis]